MSQVTDRDVQMLKKRFCELSRTAYHREVITYSDFLNLNEQNILHTLPKEHLYTKVVSFGGYETAERQMAAFVPDALSLREEEIRYPLCPVRIAPRNRRFAEELSHRDYLGAVLNLGIDRSKTGDIIRKDDDAVLFVHRDIAAYITEELTKVRRTPVTASVMNTEDFTYTPSFEEIRGTVASVRLDSLLPLAFSSSRSRLRGLIEGEKVFVNGKQILSNGYQVKEGDVISVRGMGKFRYEGSGGTTRKNRITVLLRKYT